MVCAHIIWRSNLPHLKLRDLFPNENFSGEKDSGKVLIIIIILFLLILIIVTIIIIIIIIIEWNDVNCGNANEMSMWPSQWIAI